MPPYVLLPASSPSPGGPPPLDVILPPSSPALGGPPPLYVPLPPSSGSFTPLSLGVTLKQWLDPTNPGITLSGSQIVAFPDSTANANNGGDNGVPSFRPTISTGALNGLSMMLLASGQVLPSASAVNIVAPGGARTVFVVLGAGSASQALGKVMTFTIGANAFVVSQVDFAGATGVYATTNYAQIQTVPLINYATPRILMVSWTGTATDKVVCEISGVAKTVTQSNGTETTVETGTAGWTVGALSGEYDGLIGDIAVCDTVLSAPNKALMTTFFKTKWGIA